MTRSWHQHAKRAPAAQRTSSDGAVFDSRSELARWNMLLLMQRAGEISELQRQVRFPLVLPNGVAIKTRSPGFPNGRACFYTADFGYRDKSGARIVEEHKGFDDPAARLRRAVAEAIYGITITITGAATKAKKTKARVAKEAAERSDLLL